MDTRQQRGQVIAETCKISKRPGPKGDVWLVPSQSGGPPYAVRLHADLPTCSCPDYELREMKCKHIFAVEYSLKRQQNADGTTTETRTTTVTETVKRPTYKQVWPAYNKAQTREKEHFLTLLADLCAGIVDETPPRKGQARLPLQDAIFSAVFKVYSTVSGRRFSTDLRDAAAKGLIRKAPHFNSIFNYLENPVVTDILTALIAESARPLKSVEVDFACDSSGFMSSRFVRWFDHKYGVPRQEHDWVKVHLMCGVKTNVVTAVEILDRHAADSPVMPDLVDATAKTFKIREVSADKGYHSVSNTDAVAKHGGVPFIAYKNNSTGKAGGLFAQMFHYFQFRREDFLKHYHKRSNVESTFSMMKAKFGDAVRSKTDVAMKNEVLAKVLCHNLVCLIHEMYELGISPMFWGESGPDERQAAVRLPGA